MTDGLDGLAAALADRYRIERELGAGGMATVYLADDLKHRRKVAIKILKPELTAAVAEERFLREIKITAGLDHPHILPLLDSGAAAGFSYYVMPYVEGETLRDRLDRETQLPIDDAVQIAREVAGALSYAQSRGVVHRDIKPANVLLADGHARVLDFGIARALSAAGSHRLTETGLAIGTPTYMSPEQVSGEQEVDARSDVYSLACVTYEMLTGEPPFTGPTAHAVMTKRMYDPVPSARRMRETLSGGIDAALRRGLARVPADRYATPADFAGALAAGLTQDASVTDRVSPLRRVAPALVAAIALVAAGIWTLTGRGGEPVLSATQIAVLPFEVRGNPEYAYLGRGMVDLLSTRLDGAGSWRSADPRAVLALVGGENGLERDPRRGEAIAGDLGAGLYVQGSIVEAGDRLRMDASLYDRTAGEVIARAEAEGPATQVFEMVDGVATQLLAGQTGGGGARVSRVALVTTNSLPALKAYLQGVTAFREANFPEALVAFQQAIAADSTFALAWYQLSVTADWLPRPDIGHAAAEQAVRYADRLSERDRRLLEALLANRRGDAREAERLYRGILGTYPDDLEALSQLAEVLFHHGPLWGQSGDLSREAWTRFLTYEPNQVTALVHLARIEARAGDTVAFDTLAQRVIELNPTGDRAPEMRVLSAFIGRRGEPWSDVVEDLQRETDPTLAEAVWSAGTLLRPEDAIEVARVATGPSRSNEIQARGYVWIAYLELARGRWSAARTAMAAGERLDPEIVFEYWALPRLTPFAPVDTVELRGLYDRVLAWDGDVDPAVSQTTWIAAHDHAHRQIRAYLLGQLAARLGAPSEAERWADVLETLPIPPETGSALSDFARGVRAATALAAGRDTVALAILEGTERDFSYQFAASSPYLSLGLERYRLALLLDAAGRTDEALQWLGSFAETSFYDHLYLAPSYLQRAQIYERLRRPAEAVPHYRRFIELWRDADPHLQGLVQQARERLRQLEEAEGHR